MSALSTIDSTLIQMMQSSGYVTSVKITDTLQGSIWKSLDESTNKPVIIKFADINRLMRQTAIVNQQEISVHENLKKESQILQDLSHGQCSKFIPKYLASGQSNGYYCLIMTDGGCSLFDFVVSVHGLIDKGYVDIAQWHKLTKIIFKKMIKCIEYIHSKNVCHFDISLENWLINDIDVCVDDKNRVIFCIDDEDSVQIKLCDFGLAELFADIDANNTGFQANKYCGKSGYQSPEISSRKESFSAKSNDIWCLGTCLFMMIIGKMPWMQTIDTDATFNMIMNGDIVYLLSAWNKDEYVNHHIIGIFESFFRMEEDRVSIDELKSCSW